MNPRSITRLHSFRRRGDKGSPYAAQTVVNGLPLNETSLAAKANDSFPGQMRRYTTDLRKKGFDKRSSRREAVEDLLSEPRPSLDMLAISDSQKLVPGSPAGQLLRKGI
jgi:hypothetical protein